MLSLLMALRIGASKLTRGLFGLSWIGSTLTSKINADWYIDGLLDQVGGTTYTIPIENIANIGKTITQSTFSKVISNNILIKINGDYDFSTVNPSVNIDLLKIENSNSNILSAHNGEFGIAINSIIFNITSHSAQMSIIGGLLNNLDGSSLININSYSWIEIINNDVKSISFNNLINIAGGGDIRSAILSIYSNNSLVSINLDSLRDSNGFLSIYDNENLSNLNFPNLTSISYSLGAIEESRGSFAIYNNYNLNSINFNLLQEIVSSPMLPSLFSLENNNLSNISMPSLTLITNTDVNLNENDNLEFINFNKLIDMDGCMLFFGNIPNVTYVDFNKLTNMTSSNLIILQVSPSSDINFSSLNQMIYSNISIKTLVPATINMSSLSYVDIESSLNFTDSKLTNIIFGKLAQLDGEINLSYASFNSLALDELFISLASTITSAGSVAGIYASNQSTLEQVTSASLEARNYLENLGITIVL